LEGDVRVKVRFRFSADTGEVEAFVVEDLDGRQAGGLDHDARHARAAADVARVIEQHALIEEFLPDDAAAVRTDTTRTAEAGGNENRDESPGEQRDRRLRG
jgi:hypothetical protein